MPPAHSRPGSPTLVGLALLSVVFGPGSCARDPAVGRLASPSPAPAIASPEVTADGRVTLRLWAPRAQQVWVRGLFFQPRLDMTRDPRGVWTARTGPVAAGLYEYHFVVDDLAMVDPANPDLEPSPRPENSLLEIPGDPPPLTAWQDVPHGTVHVHHYSRARAQRGNPAAPTPDSRNPPQRVRRVHVYTPPGYETAARGQLLPMLVLLHGAGGNDATWSVYGRAGFILDNLLAQKRAQPMIVVMPDGHAAGPEPAAAGSGARPDNTPAFARELFEDVLPLVESRYPVRPDAAGRAIVGLSMGGRQALRVGLETPGRFAWVGGMGASVPRDLIPGLVEAAVAQAALRWLWIGCGRADPGFARNKALADGLAARGVPAIWHATEDGHRWPVWRSYFVEIAGQLFGEMVGPARTSRSPPGWTGR